MNFLPIERRMTQLLRPLVQSPRWRHRKSPRYASLIFHPHFPRLSGSGNLPFFAFFSISSREVRLRSRATELSDSFPEVADESGISTSDSSVSIKSRNEKKRDARRAVHWGMELASFSPPQIKRILRVAQLEEEVFDALMLVKRLGRDVKEGKRRQFNYIGRLIREVEPELMESLIQATKDGDVSKFEYLLGTEIMDVDGEEEEDKEDEENEGDWMSISIVSRWYDGLVNKDANITKEIYSLRDIEFDRQELRQLVRKVHSTREAEASSEENGQHGAAILKNRRLLTRFLRRLVSQLPSGYTFQHVSSSNSLQD